MYSVHHYGFSGYSYILFLPVIVGGVTAVLLIENFRKKKLTMPKEISFPVMGIGLAMLSLIAYINISPLEISILLIPFFNGTSQKLE